LKTPYITRQELLEKSQIFILKQVLAWLSSAWGLSADISHLFNTPSPFKQEPAPCTSGGAIPLIFKKIKIQIKKPKEQ
jgi:hypothetical protein